MKKTELLSKFYSLFLASCITLSVYGVLFTYHAESAPVLTKYWQSVTSSLDGARLFAVVNGGNIYSSNDGGITWAQITFDAKRSWFSIASDQTGMKLVAVVNGGNVYSSIDGGVTWTATKAPIKGWRAVASNADGSKLIAGG